jgi:hypothetical protein
MRPPRKLLLTALFALATSLLVANQAMPAPALQGSDVTLLGQWEYSYLSNANYSGRIIVDARGMTNLTASWSGGPAPSGSVSESGHVVVDIPAVEFVFTSAKTADGRNYNLDDFRCTLQSSNALDCYNHDVAGSTSSMFILSRIGASR